MFVTFDLDCDGLLKYVDLLFLFKCCLIGHGKMTNQTMPSIDKMDKVLERVPPLLPAYLPADPEERR